MPLRDIQPVQDIRMAGLVRRDERLEDDVIHQLPVARLMAQDRQSLIDPVQQQAGLPNAEQAVLQLRVPQRHLRVHYAEQRVQILQRLIQLLCDFTGEAFQGPDDVPVVLEHDLGVMVHIPAKLLLRKPDVLLLDEPTNHLDIESIQWLENFIATRANAVILVSHDRAFIDNTTFRTIEIELGKIYDYKVKYSEYVELRKERREQQLRAFENQQKKLADTEAFIERFRYKATKSVQVQSRIKQLEKVERIEVDEVDTAMLSLKFPPAPRSGSYPVIAEDVAKRYGDHLIFEHATFTINRGDKVAFVGKNGEGKSTLVKCIMGEITDFTGKLQLGHNVKIGYFAQNQAQLLDENMTVFDTVDYVAQGDIRLKIRDILGAFMFGGEASDKKVKVLSGGEKTRLAMIRLLLEPVNLLILDEPTNHLDMRSKDVLKDALKEFDGTVIVVSHDREFLDGLVDKVYEFGNKRVIEHLGGIYDFLEHKKMDSLCELERSTQTTTSMEGNAAEPTRNKLSYEARKEQSKAIKKVEKAIAESEKKITELENSIAAIEAKLATPEGAADVSLYTEYSELKKKLSDTMDLWTEQTLELEELNAANS